jgi:aldehyde dehydrogenase (NAD+)
MEHFVPPTVFKRGTADAHLPEEIFGPVVCAIPFDTEEAIKRANATPFGLGSGVDTGWGRLLARAARRLGVVNCYQLMDPAMPSMDTR